MNNLDFLNYLILLVLVIFCQFTPGAELLLAILLILFFHEHQTPV